MKKQLNIWNLFQKKIFIMKTFQTMKEIHMNKPKKITLKVMVKLL